MKYLKALAEIGYLLNTGKGFLIVYLIIAFAIIAAIVVIATLVRDVRRQTGINQEPEKFPLKMKSHEQNNKPTPGGGPGALVGRSEEESSKEEAAKKAVAERLKKLNRRRK